MAKAEFVPLAHDYDPEKVSIGGWMISEKLDGMRAIWDGGISRGKLARDVPYANIEKDSRYFTPPIATGLWSRYGKVIHAPDWWLDNLPPYPLDGELYCGRGSFQTMRSTVSTLIPGAGWTVVDYMVFESPPWEVLFGDRTIKNTIFKKTFSGIVKDFVGLRQSIAKPDTVFETNYSRTVKLLEGNQVAKANHQTQLPFNTPLAEQIIRDEIDRITDLGGEGLIVRSPSALWLPERTWSMLKVKKLKDAEATVIGYTSGRKTDLGSKLLGMMGALVVSAFGKTFELSGFTDEERWFDSDEAKEWATTYPGQRCPEWIVNKSFPIGAIVTFRYRELTDVGIPKEARYLRKG